MPYADLEFYKQDFLIGRKSAIPDDDFLFYSSKATTTIDELTFNRLLQNEYNEGIMKKVKLCCCELAEHHYLYEGTEGKTQENISGYSATYAKGIEYQIAQRYLTMTGLLYRGGNY